MIWIFPLILLNKIFHTIYKNFFYESVSEYFIYLSECSVVFESHLIPSKKNLLRFTSKYIERILGCPLYIRVFNSICHFLFAQSTIQTYWTNSTNFYFWGYCSYWLQLKIQSSHWLREMIFFVFPVLLAYSLQLCLFLHNI